MGGIMLWNAPIWLNETLVNIIKFIIGVLPIFICIGSFCILYSFIKFLIYKRKYKRKVINFIKSPSALVVFSCIAASSIALRLFYFPQEVMPEKYNFSEIWITTITRSSGKSDPIIIKDKEKLNELKDIFRGYLCKRSIVSDLMIDSDSNTVLIDLAVVYDNRFTPLHFIINKKYQYRYTGANVDFLYEIQGDKQQLAEKVFDFVNNNWVKG